MFTLFVAPAEPLLKFAFCKGVEGDDDEYDDGEDGDEGKLFVSDPAWLFSLDEPIEFSFSIIKEDLGDCGGV